MVRPVIDPFSLLLSAPRRIESLGGSSEFPRDYSSCDHGDSTLLPVGGGVIAAMLHRVPGAHFARGEMADRARANVVVQRDAALPAQHYRLTVRDGVATIEASERAGAIYGLATLGQLAALTHGRVPNCVISDSPDYPVRGFMLDVSRNRVPTMETLTDLVVLLARLKINHLELYTEHTFAYAGHEDVWREASPITPTEMRDMARLCDDFAIDLCPNQNTLGHLAPWFAHQRYADLAETHGEWTFEFEDRRITRHGPFSLCPTDPRSLELVRDLLRQLTPCTRGAYLNIGCDEAYDIGSGRSREQVARRGREAVYLDHLMGVCAIARELGRTPLYWADIVLHSDAAIDAIARSPMRDAVALVWGYEGDSPFEAQTRRLRSAGIRHWVCPGTSSWRSIVGRNAVSRENISRALRAGLAPAITGASASGGGGGVVSGGSGALLTDWGDMGHRQQWVVSLPALARFAAGAWNSDAPIEDAAIARALWGNHGAPVLDALEALCEADEPLRRSLQRGRLRNAGALFTDLHRPLSVCTDDAAVWGEPGAWQECLRALEAMRTTIEGLRVRLADVPDGARTAAEIAHTWRVAHHAARRAVLSREHAPGAGAGAWPRREAIEMSRDMDELIAEHEALWRGVSREGGLAQSTAHYLGVRREYDSASQ